MGGPRIALLCRLARSRVGNGGGGRLFRQTAPGGRGSTTVVRRALLVLAVLLARPVLADDSMRCGSRLVAADSLEAEVVAKCGNPDYRDRRVMALPYGRYDADTEIWYYNRGPSQLIRVLTFRDGRLVDVDTDGYGFVPPDDPHCSQGEIGEGMSKFRLLSFCGEPISRNARGIIDSAPMRTGPGNAWRAYPVQVYREEWVYNFGPNHFLCEVTLDNGVVTDVRSADRRGFNPP